MEYLKQGVKSQALGNAEKMDKADQVVILPKYYADVCENNPDPKYADYENLEIEFGF